MRKLLVLPFLVLLTGCVSYYYPETALEDGVYYAEDDPSYMVYSGGYTDAVYYPWYSLDYFYLGYYPAPAYSIGYTYSSGFSFGFSYGFAPWYYPYHYYGYYSPWYGSHHHHHRYTYHPAWRPYRGYHSGRRGGHHGSKKHDRDDQHDRYARDARDARRHHEDDHDDQARKRGGGQEQPDYGRSSSVRRYVSTAPGGTGGERGMVIRNRDSAKVGESRLHVDKAASKGVVKTGATQTRAELPDYSTRSTAGEVRYRSNAKQTKSRTGPVSPSALSRDVVISTTPDRVVSNKAPKADYSTRGGGGEVRYRSNAKQSKSRTGPVSAGASSKGLAVKTAPASGARASGGRSGKPSAATPVKRQATARTPSSNRASPSKSSKSKQRSSHSTSSSDSRKSSRRKNHK